MILKPKMQSTTLALRPRLLRISRPAAVPAPRRVAVVKASVCNSADRRAALGAAFVSGVALFGSPTIAAPLSEPVASTVSVVTTPSPASAPQLGPGAEAPKLQPAAPLTPAATPSLDPKVLGGAAAAVVVIAGLAVAGQNQGGDEAEGESAVGVSTETVKKVKKTKKQDLSQLKKAEEALKAEYDKLEALKADAAEVSASLVSATTALEAARAECSKAMAAATEGEAGAGAAAKALSKAQKSLQALSGRNPMQKFFGQLSGGPSEEDAQAALEKAQKQVAAASESSRTASVNDRQLWIKQYRAASAVEAARVIAAEKASAVDAQAGAVKAAEEAMDAVKVALGLSLPPLSGGITSEASLEERLTDRREWIAGYKAQGAPSPAPDATATGEATTFDATSSEAGFADRLQDRRAWIAGYKARNPAAVQKLEEAVGETGTPPAATAAASPPPAPSSTSSSAVPNDEPAVVRKWPPVDWKTAAKNKVVQ